MILKQGFSLPLSVGVSSRRLKTLPRPYGRGPKCSLNEREIN